jgi:hypothetical protein
MILKQELLLEELKIPFMDGLKLFDSFLFNQ